MTKKLSRQNDVCHDKCFVAIFLFLSRQKLCRDKHTFVAMKDVFCREKHVLIFVATKMSLVAALASDTQRGQ